MFCAVNAPVFLLLFCDSDKCNCAGNVSVSFGALFGGSDGILQCASNDEPEESTSSDSRAQQYQVIFWAPLVPFHLLYAAFNYTTSKSIHDRFLSHLVMIKVDRTVLVLFISVSLYTRDMKHKKT